MKVAIVGCGSIAQVHARCLSLMEGIELLGFCDVKIDRAELLVKEYGGCAYISYSHMLENYEIESIHICTPHYLHVPMALSAMKHGKHVFMEKPPVMTRDELIQLEEAIEESKSYEENKRNKYLGFCFQNRYNPSVIKVKEMLVSGDPGKLLAVRGIVTWGRHYEYYAESDWRGKLEKEGGGVLINQSIHTLDLMNYFIEDDIEMLDAMMGNHHLRGLIEVEDTMSIYLKYKNCSATFYASNAYPISMPPIIELLCKNVRIRIEDLLVTCIHKNNEIEVIPITAGSVYGKRDWGVGHERCIRDFYHCIYEKRRFPQDLDGVRESVQLMLDAYGSARENHPVYYEEKVR